MTPEIPAQGAKSSGMIAPFLVRVSDRQIAIGIFAVCLSYLCIFLRYSALELDEGIVLQGAERILHGEIPYRDFFSFYTPGSFYLVAFVFRIFGDHFITARFSIAVIGALCSVVTYLLARRVCSRGTAILCALLATTTGAAFRFLVLHNPYSTLFACLSLYFAIRSVETRRVLAMFLTGSLASMCLLVEQSKGVGLFAGLLLGFLLVWFHESWPAKARAFLGFLFGSLWPLVTTFAYFSAHGTAGIMVEDWLWPLKHYTRANHVPYGFQNWSEATIHLIFQSGPWWLRALKILAISPTLVVPILPLVAIAILGYQVWSTWIRGSKVANSSYYILFCAACLGLLSSVIVVRPDSLHFMYLAPIWYVILAWVLDVRVQSIALERIRPFLYAYVFAAFGMLTLASLLPATGARHEITTRRGKIRTSSADTVIPDVQAQVMEGDKMLVYPYLPLYNYLTGTQNPSRYDFFQPGMNTSDQARDILRSLEGGSSSVLLQPGFAETIPHSWAYTPLSVFATDQVSDYIVRNYRVCKVLRSPDNLGFWWMVPKTRVCP